MSRFIATAVACLLAGSTLAAEPPLVLETTIALHGVSGRIDHMAIDLPRKRLIVAELGNNTVDVIDLDKRAVVHRISGLREPQGVAYAQAAGMILIANAGDGSVRLINAQDFSSAGRVDLHDDADNVRIDSRNGLAVVGYGDGGLAVIDPAQGALRGKIPLTGHPEAFQLTPEGRVYVNVPDARGIAVADLNAGKATASWTFPGLSANFPMALGEPGIVAVVFRSPARFVRIDGASGHEISRSNTCGDADDVFFDARRQRYYVSCGEGVVDTFDVAGGRVTALAPVATSGGARTSLFVPELDRLFVAARAGLLGSDASIRVLRPPP